MSFRVDLKIFRGPLDLLLYLVRKHEMDILDIPVAPITDQFLDHLAVMEQIDIARGRRLFGDGQHADRNEIADGVAGRRRSG